MKNASLLTAVGIVLLGNGFALVHAALNRSGSPDAELTLSNRELSYYLGSNFNEDSEVSLTLLTSDVAHPVWPASPDSGRKWLDKDKLRSLGFNCSADPSSSDAQRFYSRQRPRKAFAALEFNGPAWQELSDAYTQGIEHQPVQTTITAANDYRLNGSRLIAVDADLNPASLRARHPDRNSVAIMPVVVGIGVEGFRPARLTGYLSDLPTSIHVPLPYSNEFRQPDRLNRRPPFLVRLRFGSSYEPWVEGVEFQ